MMKNFLIWLLAIGRWFFYEARHFWLAIGLIAFACVVALILDFWCPANRESIIRLTGLLLQLFGIGTVIWGINETRAFFGHASIVKIVSAWLQRFPHFPKKITVTMHATLPGLLGSMSARIVTSCKADRTIEERVEAFEKSLALTNEKIDSAKKYLDQKITKTIATIKQEEQTRAAEDLHIHKKIEATSTGGVHISLIGAIWLFVGVTLSTASPEISGWLK